MANKVPAREDARQHIDRSTPMRERRTIRVPPIPPPPHPPARLAGKAAEAQLLAIFSPAELARLTPSELRLLAHNDDDLPVLSEDEQHLGEQRYRKRLVMEMTTVEHHSTKKD